MKNTSFKGDKKLKADLLAEIVKHRKADQIVKGTYGDNNNPQGGFCGVGCSIHSLNVINKDDHSTSDHEYYGKEVLGGNEWLARLEDTIFEGLPLKKAKLWPEQFIKAIPVGVNLEPVKWKFCAFILKENIERVLTLKISDELKKQVVDSIRGVLSLHIDAIKTDKWDESAVESAARSARSAVESAAWSARSAAWSAAWSARSAAWSAESAVESAAYKKYAKELIRLLKLTK